MHKLSASLSTKVCLSRNPVRSIYIITRCNGTCCSLFVCQVAAHACMNLYVHTHVCPVYDAVTVDMHV